jgi:hypothetical protein
MLGPDPNVWWLVVSFPRLCPLIALSTHGGERHDTWSRYVGQQNRRLRRDGIVQESGIILQKKAGDAAQLG